MSQEQAPDTFDAKLRTGADDEFEYFQKHKGLSAGAAAIAIGVVILMTVYFDLMYSWISALARMA